MHSRLQRRIQRYGWDKATPHYENGWQESLKPVQDRLVAIADPQPGEHIVDMAAGTGMVSIPLANAIGAEGLMVATDISAIMLAELERRSELYDLRQIKTLRADAESLGDLEDGQFDLVTCSLGLMYLPEPIAAMRHAFRLLKPGGRAVFSVWGARKNCGWADIFPIVDSRVASDVCPMFFRLGTKNMLALELAEAGFNDVEEERLRTELPFANDKTALSAAFAGGPVALAYDRFDAETKKSAHAEYLASIATYKSSIGYSIPGEFVVVSGQKMDNRNANST